MLKSGGSFTKTSIQVKQSNISGDFACVAGAHEEQGMKEIE
jgi:hypothetical protein